MTCRDSPRAPDQLFSSPLSLPGMAQNKYSHLSAAGKDQCSPPLGISTMKLFTGLILCSLVLGVHSQWMSFLGEAYEGAKDMWRAYSDMREANYKGADKYFHARGNYDAAQRGPGGAWAAKVISDARENIQRFTDPLFKGTTSGKGQEDSRADQAANEWGRSGKDPNHFRPAGLPDKY
ncbi:serum amyloid A protein-like [Bos javanicus]|uniref:serum amyloid A protein-like n=1 Tax=Bos javanicus TaxID=9906 RepID=UPI002AA6F40E|nr:serum amyloid A protein-like [Bos javanicus]